MILTGGAVGAAQHYTFDPVLGYLAGITLATFLLYGYDKAIAGANRTRVPERVLHILTLLGGTVGAFAGQTIFRHKTLKGSFRWVFWLTVLVQAGAVFAWFWYVNRPA